MDKYVKVRKIGQGSFGCAYLATRNVADSTESSDRLSKHQFVIKEVVLDPRDQASAQREARLLAALDHPNIIACKESFLLKTQTPNAAFLGRHQRRPTVLCIVTEFADGGDLSHELARRTSRHEYFEPDDLLGLFVQVCLALKHLHDRKILHRDVKPANIFLTKSGVVKLGDLGVATVLSHTLACAQTSIGTPYYTAPEICLGKRYNAKADVWSLGCVLFEMASFSHAFEVLGVQGKTPNSSKRTPPPAPINIRRQQAKLKTPGPAPKTRGLAVRDSQLSLREHRLEFQRKTQAEQLNANGKPRTTKASPLDDPVILVQQLPEFKTPPPPPAEQVAVLPPPAPTTLTSSLPEFADKNAELVHVRDSTRTEAEEDDLDLTSLPSMANLEFERMVLQLKSAVESDMNSSEDEIDDEDEQSEELFTPNVPPPPYSLPATTPTPPFSLETLNIAVLEDPAFRLALQKRLQLQSSATEQVQVDSADQLVVDPTALDWMHTYVASLL
ncbi:hypothetical protein PF005_g9569 [Phytophthora fragariae]|uniref:non-specific serine/threonine protein kinase n=1 Tax=Phytophthora fragariae TaxID=53985 RepID=A0A6A3YAJ9_9STRA|nr:hypothetical protein PF009_g9404 [Phytophthora fragariae]KAE9215084.1 hypothetical protein PF005_g9569 [Phytophthora fragariae]KAE9240146.1 hypothetical protein PF004_g7627 [Phytophthora fragariae]